MTFLPIELHQDAVALRVVRVFKTGEGFRYYEATTFPDNPRQGCALYLRRCEAFGFLVSNDALIVVDGLNADGDIIQDFPLTRPGLRYLQRELGFKVDVNAE